ncbi:hypothetical protein [Streptomyces sp. 4F14]|uniref:hypothetical protein n=1 Tax=Streptomyces sp. 4F14 TaxID=3394380 RepID=UPI003A883A3D
MDENDENTTAGTGLTDQQQELLAQFAVRRAARLAVAASQTPQAELELRLREMDEALAAHPDRDNPLVQENHELKRHTAILEEAIRAFIAGELVASTRP